MRLQIGDVRLEVTDDQAADLRRQLGVAGNGSELIDTTAAAKRLGVGTEYVREHARELGGRKLGDGPKARWRFDPAKLEASSPSQAVQPERQAPKSRRRKAGLGKDLLEIRGGSPYAG